MEVQQILHMNGGNGESSYASNSNFQKLVITKAKPVVIGSISDLYTTNLPTCLRVADLGCSSGPNTLLVISEIIEAIDETCHQLNHTTPEFQVFLNDLPSNDFNTIFKTLPAFYEQLKMDKGEQFGPCSITGLPGSFYERLFPSTTIDFFHSSYSLHWLSQVPPMVESNKGNIYLARTSPPTVLKAYLNQFQKDFSLFLSLRSKEIIAKGHMVLTIPGRRSEETLGKESYILEFLSKSLNDMVPPMVESNKGNIYLARTSPPSVLKAYLNQFQKDFSLFLSLRSKEIIAGGRMVLTILGRRSEEPFGKDTYFLEFLSKSLNDLVSEGLIEEAKVDSFNFPFYFPSRQEVEAIVSTEGSFVLDQLEIFDVNWDASDDDENKELLFDRFISGQKTGKTMRAVVEPMMAFNFGDDVMDVLFYKYAEYVSDHLSKEKIKLVSIVISLRGK